MHAACLFFGILFITGGVLFRQGRLHVYLNAWKQMPQEEKEKINAEALCANIGTMILLCGMIFFLAGISAHFKEHYFVWDMILWLIASGIDVCYIEKTGKYSRS